MDNTPPALIDTAPSGKATGAKEDEAKGTETILALNIDSPTKVLAIDTSQVEKKSITEMSPTKLMMMATQKLIKEGSTDKGIIDHSITVLHRLILDC